MSSPVPKPPMQNGTLDLFTGRKTQADQGCSDTNGKMIRSSSYSNRIDIGKNDTVLFNGMSLCMDLVPQQYAERIARNDVSFLSAEEKTHLLNRGHLTALSQPQELRAFRDQVRIIHNKNTELLLGRRQLCLTFLLTYRCNLACRYCYQGWISGDSRTKTMSPEMADMILMRFSRVLFPAKYRKGTLTFILFGGEPFLPPNRETILHILRYAKGHSIRVSTTTNGLFVPDVIDLFGREYGKIQVVQVTLDGNRRFHDTQRIPLSGKPTFDLIISSLRMLKDTGAQVLLRIHTHPQQMKSNRQLIKYLEKEGITGGNVRLYFAPLGDFQVCSQPDLDDFRSLFQSVGARLNVPPSSNLSFLKGFIDMQHEKILPKTAFCSVGSDTVRIIDPLGDVYACYEDAGNRRRRIGTITNGKPRFFGLRKSYAERYLLNIPKCLRCSVALLCGGGCPARARTHTGSIFKPYCHQVRAFIEETLKYYFLVHKTQMKGDSDES
jgi:uncharacterized protein